MIKVTFLALLLVVSYSFQLQTDIQQPQEDLQIAKNVYPARFTYINRITSWYGDSIAKSLAVPGFAPDHIYNYVILTFWGCRAGPMDIALLWQNASLYFGDQSSFGKTTPQVQQNLRKAYNNKGIKLLVSAFGDGQWPTTLGLDATVCGTKFGQFVRDNNLDGGDVDWEDNTAMQAGTGEQWLIKFTQAFRAINPNLTLTHSPQAPYFKKQYYKNGGYITVHKAVGSQINFYNIQFYNQGNSKYDNYQQLVENATGTFSGTSLMEIVKRGVPAKKLVMLKPATPSDASNTGYMTMDVFGDAVTKAYNDHKWFAGVGFWQYSSDATGDKILKAAGHLKQLCAINQDCK